MHEMALCENVVRATLAEFEKLQPRPRRLCRIHVVAGGLHQIVPDFFKFAYTILTRETVAEGSDMKLTVSPVVGRCQDCAWEGEIQLPFFECGACRRRNVDVIQGMEIVLEKLEVEEL